MKNIILLITLVILTTSCASIVSGTTTKIAINSQPVGAKIKSNGIIIGETPTTIEISNKVTGAIAIEKQGYKTSYIPLKKSLNGWLWGNIVFGGVIGLVVDLAAGGAYDIDNDKAITRVLQKLK